MMTDCGVDMKFEFGPTGMLNVGSSYQIPGTKYILKPVVIQCDAMQPANDQATIEVRKNGLLVGNATISFNLGATLMDNNKLCVYFQAYDCVNTAVSLRGGWNPSQKILVTNLNLPDYLLPVVGGVELEYTGQKSVDANGNYRYVFNQNTEIVQFGPGAFLERILASQYLPVIATLILGILGFVLVWYWLNGDTQVLEAEHEMQQENTDRINAIQNDPTLTPAQKTELIKGVLENERKAIEGASTDWSGILMWSAVLVGIYAVYKSGLLTEAGKTVSKKRRTTQ